MKPRAAVTHSQALGLTLIMELSPRAQLDLSVVMNLYLLCALTVFEQECL